MRCTAPVFGSPGAVLGQPFVQVMAQVLAIKHKYRTAHVEQLALNGVGQGTFTRARQPAEQHSRRLLTEALRTLLSRHVGQFAMMA